MRKLLLSLTVVFVGARAFAQQDYQFSQYMFDRLSINPAFAGIENKICGTGIFRQQWAKFDGAPMTTLINVHGPVKKVHGGVGLSYYNDQIGFFKNNTVRLNYSFHAAMPGNGVLGIGISAGLMSVSLNPNWIAITSPTLDAAIPDNGSNYKESAIDFGFGLYYRAPTWYAGISATHLSESDLTQLNVQNVRHYYVMAGWDKALNGGEWTLRPSMRLETVDGTTQVDANFNVLWNNMVWAGVSYRIKDAIVPMVGYQKAFASKKTPGMLRIGYSYDVTTSDIKTYSSGSHEIMVSYCFNVFPPNPIQKSKTVRFL